MLLSLITPLFFCPENVFCCKYLSALQTGFHGSKQYEPLSDLREQSDQGPYCLQYIGYKEHMQTRGAEDESRDWQAKG